MMPLSSRSFCSGDSRQAGLWYLPAGWRDTTRYGLDADEQHSLQDIGDVFGISRERVRQLEKQAFAKLRQLPQSAELAELAR
jgi:Sigma-70, region 4